MSRAVVSKHFPWPSVIVAFLSLCLFLAGCSQLVPVDPQQTVLSSDHAPHVQGALLQAVAQKSDGTLVYTYRAWTPVIQLELIQGDKCLLEITNVPAVELKTVFNGEQGLADPVSAGIDLQKPRSTVITAAIPKGVKGKLLLEPPADWGVGGSFAVIGDTQGNNEAFQTAIKQINLAKPDFVVHVGDLTPSGQEEEMVDFLQASNELFCPLYSVPGNHDVKTSKSTLYEKMLAPAYYTFDWGVNSLVFLDNSSGSLSGEQLSFLGDAAGKSRKALVFMHMPVVDPRGGTDDHAMTDKVAVATFLSQLHELSKNLRAVFNGHIHMYDQYQQDGVQYVTSGGGGASLYAEADKGGYHHWLMIHDLGGNIPLDIKVNEFQPPPRRDSLTLSGPGGTLLLDAQQIQELDTLYNLEGTGSFQNQYGNINGQGTYSGIPIRKLLEKVGGMTDHNKLVVSCVDGYQQEFVYTNVYPEKAGWQKPQGDMILAVRFNSQGLPEWKDGYRIAFLTADGLYDNKDCENTSVSGEGWHRYKSAGARWVRFVVKLEVK